MRAEQTIRASTEIASQLSVRRRSWLSRCLPLAAVAILTGSFALSASAGTNGLDITVAKALPSTVSLGSPNLAAYKFTITNNQSSGVNNVWLNANTSVLNGGSAKFVQSSSSPEVCLSDLATSTQVSCAIGAIAPGASASIVLVFGSPSQGTEIDVTYWLSAGQGGPSPVPGSNAFNLGTLSTFLTAAVTGSNGKKGTNVSTAQTYVLAGHSLAAGLVELSGATSKVTPPTSQGVAISQFVPSDSCSSMYKTCFNTQVDILDDTGVVQFNSHDLTIVLTRGASTLKGNASIDNAVLQYRATASGPWLDIVACNNSGLPSLTAATYDTVNCYVPAAGGKKGAVDGSGNWVFTLRAGQNGFRNY